MPEHQGASESVKVHIDQKVYSSKNPTTGAELYDLAQLELGRELFLAVPGTGEDVFIERNSDEVRLSENDHLVSGKEITIIVNGKQKSVAKAKKLSYSALVTLAFENPPTGANVQFTITYRNGPRQNPEGTLVEGGTVKIQDGMVFNVTPTDKS